MSGAQQGKPATDTLADQAVMIDTLVQRCTMVDGRVASETSLLLRPEDVQRLAALRDRLHRMAPHENQIRRVVVGR